MGNIARSGSGWWLQRNCFELKLDAWQNPLGVLVISHSCRGIAAGMRIYTEAILLFPLVGWFDLPSADCQHYHMINGLRCLAQASILKEHTVQSSEVTLLTSPPSFARIGQQTHFNSR
jgi:hypothetical protein